MFDVVLYQPEIAPNTGNVIRLCANTGARLHLVKPLGFRIDDRKLVRAGLDYHDLTRVTVHEDWAACLAALAGRRLFALTTHGGRRHDQPDYAAGDAFVFGPETRGLPAEVVEGFAPERRLRLPMVPNNRSLNLGNSVAVVVFEAWRQLGFAGAVAAHGTPCAPQT
ncbi:MAG: tRNA (cytidine(34)-2'-O)-methyltransferase [Betaproteobacteria bacterium]|nr:tRNA (cytidine(34)-2'-O)-methyltransferase [Betaproteobacteria bacterium]